MKAISTNHAPIASQSYAINPLLTSSTTAADRRFLHSKGQKPTIPTQARQMSPYNSPPALPVPLPFLFFFGNNPRFATNPRPAAPNPATNLTQAASIPLYFSINTPKLTTNLRLATLSSRNLFLSIPHLCSKTSLLYRNYAREKGTASPFLLFSWATTPKSITNLRHAASVPFLFSTHYPKPSNQLQASNPDFETSFLLHTAVVFNFLLLLSLKHSEITDFSPAVDLQQIHPSLSLFSFNQQ